MNLYFYSKLKMNSIISRLSSSETSKSEFDELVNKELIKMTDSEFRQLLLTRPFNIHDILITDRFKSFIKSNYNEIGNLIEFDSNIYIPFFCENSFFDMYVEYVTSKGDSVLNKYAAAFPCLDEFVIAVESDTESECYTCSDLGESEEEEESDED